ncbi:hypothetical protein JXB27_00950 [Candidatus Woesearchaeota archaeon]|nr:hypothetical protein [Candidatus Woesearchaeota archaeon]
MTVFEAIAKLEKSKEFVSWKKEAKPAYLAHAFVMNDEANKGLWQIGYFNPKTNLITVFVVNGNIQRQPDAEVFKEQKKMVAPLKLSEVKLDEIKAMEEGKKVLDENYKGTEVFRSFMILQDLDKVGQVWNITFVTQKFTTVNVKIDAKTGKCDSHKTISLISDTKDTK